MRRVRSAAKGDYVAVRVKRSFEIEHIPWRDARPGQVFLQGPLHAHGLARKLGEDHGVGFGAIAAKGGAPVLTGVVEPTTTTNRGYAQRIRDSARAALYCPNGSITMALPSLARRRRQEGPIVRADVGQL